MSRNIFYKRTKDNPIIVGQALPKANFTLATIQYS